MYYLRNTVLIVLTIFVTAPAFAQKDTADNYVNRFMSIPSIKVHIVPDSTVFTNENIQKQRPFVIMFFSPDCDHCQQETKELLAYKEELKGIQILMVSIASYADIKEFYNSYNLASMRNVTVGQDAGLKLGSIYRVRSYPSLFVYDQKGTLAKAFVGNIGIPAILDAVK